MNPIEMAQPTTGVMIADAILVRRTSHGSTVSQRPARAETSFQ